jgi:3D (Asp-Asp-Asp) domain-containing protein
MRILSRSIAGKVVVTLVAVTAFVWLYEATTHDSLLITGQTPADPSAPVSGARLRFAATAYCKGTTTASGATVRTGIAAADPALLPVGSVVSVTTDVPKYNGIYTVMDTGPKVQGRQLDLYMWSCYEALDFGRKAVEVTVLRLGWNPNASSPSLVDRLFRRREAARRSAQAAPVSVPDGPVPLTALPPPASDVVLPADAAPPDPTALAPTAVEPPGVTPPPGVPSEAAAPLQ